MSRIVCAVMTVLITLAWSKAVLAEETFMHAGQLAHAVDRLANCGRVLYIAAHPDDENTRLLAYLANQRHVTAAYLSMTRGGGGQNLIGPEQDELLDVIRTEELLAARRLDSATQRFTRMRDFGYSKSAAETLEIWDHPEALADVVWVIRSFQPDVIIARFDEQPPNHGHHTASAILAREAFSAAADAQRFPEQLALGVATWQAERLLLNVPTWRDTPPPADALPIDVGGYDVRLGLSYGELAARSRSQHQSQGFGVPGERGAILERFTLVAGSRPVTDLLDGVDLTWKRFGKAAAPLLQALGETRARLDRDHPEAALEALFEARTALDSLPGSIRVAEARDRLEQILAAASGLFMRATADRPGAVPGGAVGVKVEVVARGAAAATLERVRFPAADVVEVGAALGRNEKKEVTREVQIPAGSAISTPYWLAEPLLPGRQQVPDPRMVGRALGPPALEVDVELRLLERPLRLRLPVVYSWTDPVRGERIRSFLVVPPATVTPLRRAVLLPNGKPATVELLVRSGTEARQGKVVLQLPEGWRSDPPQHVVSLLRAGDETSIRFTVSAPRAAAAAEIRPAIEVDGTLWSYREDLIDYAHIPRLSVLQGAALRLVPVDLQLPKGTVGYIAGSGDSVAADLRHVGVTVETLSDEVVRTADLGRFTAIIVGIRAYNTRTELRSAHQRLMAYVDKGGTLIVQYNTNNRLSPLAMPIGPYPLTIGRERITDETARMEAIDPRHGLLQVPNEIGAADFDGWVQERGLYYAESWDERYEPIFRTADPGEKALLGGLLLARHGRGTYVYTGLAFFRQLPAGVPGAYRLFANLLAGGRR